MIRRTLTTLVAKAFGEDLVLETDDLNRRSSEQSISDMCSDAVRLREDIARHTMMAECAREELRIVDNKIMEWGCAE